MKHIGPVAFLVVIKLIKITAEQGFKILFSKKPVIMSPMDQPVSGSPLAGMMLELRRETGQDIIPARPQQR